MLVDTGTGGKGWQAFSMHRFRFPCYILATLRGTQLCHLFLKLYDAPRHQFDLVDEIEGHADTVAGALQSQLVQVGPLAAGHQHAVQNGIGFAPPSVRLWPAVLLMMTAGRSMRSA